MVRVSHQKCRQCGQAAHRGMRHNLCGRCWARRKPQEKAKWREIKQQRALKRARILAQAEPYANGVVEPVVLKEEDSPVAEATQEPVTISAMLTPEQEQEMIALYTTTDTPVTEIARAFGVTSTYPYSILKKHGVPAKRGLFGPRAQPRELPAHIAAMQEVQVPQPEKESKFTIIDNRVKPEAPKSFEQQVAEALPVTRADELPAWQVEFSGALEIRAASFDEAVKAARLSGAKDITLVKRLP